MEFCDKCGSLMIVKRKLKRSFLLCMKCGKERTLNKEKVVIAEALPIAKKEIVIIKKGDEETDLPKTRIVCPKCENIEAYWWMQQTRAADEPPTLFYKCTKCNYNWRSYE